jgi:hypothetical protein
MIAKFFHAPKAVSAGSRIAINYAILDSPHILVILWDDPACEILAVKQ